jgi:hypothetical protein
MSVRILGFGVGLLASVLLGACEDKSAGREPTAPDLAPSLSAGVMGSGHVSKFVTKGSFGYVSIFGYTAEGYENGYLFASQGGEGQQVFMYYDITQCDYSGSCSSVESGYGYIPSGDLVQEHEKLILTTNTSTAPDFYIYAGSGGPITISWTQFSGFTSRESRNMRATYGSLKVRFHETRTTYSAFAEGLLLGRTLDASVYAQMGTVHSGEIDIATGDGQATH